MAIIHRENEQNAATAGLLHDCAKCLSLSTMQAIATDNHLLLDKQTFNSANLLHGPVGATLAQRDYGVTDATILSAIRCHTTAKYGMLPLEMILFLSDKIEPSRHSYPALEVVRKLAQVSLIQAMRYMLSSSIEYAKSQGYAPHPQSLEAEKWFLRMENEEKELET